MSLGADRSQVQVAGQEFGQGTHRVVDAADPPRDLSGWAWGAYVCLGLLAILGLVRISAALDLRSTVTDGGDLVGSYDDYTRWVGIYALLLLVTAGIFITWFFQAYKNLRRLGVQNLRYGNGWAIGAWFVPILGLVRPKQIANDIWRGSERGAEVSSGWRLVPVPALLHWWWGLFVAQGLLVYFGQRSVDSGYDKLVAFGLYGNGFDQIKTGTSADVIGSIVGIAGAILAIVVVSRVTERLNEIRDEALPLAPPISQYAVAPQHPQYAQAPQSTAATPPPAPARPQYPPPPPTAQYAPAPPAPPPTQYQSQSPPSSPQPLQPPAEQRVQCPECAEWIQAEANVCRFCGHRLRPLGQ